MRLRASAFRSLPPASSPPPNSVADLLVQASPVESYQKTGSPQGQGDLIRVGDFAHVDLGYRDPPLTIMRYDGQPAIALAISNQPGVNVVDMGKKVDARLAELIVDLPVGIDVHRVHWQSALIDEAVRDFFVSLAEAVLIVLAVLWLAMGWRMGVIIGSSIVLTILGTFVVMAGIGIDLQRMSLGALIIALGMMVDNSIVVAEGALVRMQRGMDRVNAAVEAAAQPAWPLLGRHCRRGAGFLPDRRIDGKRRRILRLAVLRRGHLAAAELGHLSYRYATSMYAATARQTRKGRCRAKRPPNRRIPRAA